MGDPMYGQSKSPAEALASVPAPVLLPGVGFDGPPAAALPPVGAGPGADAVAIARWNVVPFQTITESLDLGVVAFHMNRIDRVEFSVEGGPWTAVRHMTHSERTGATEYRAVVRAEDFSADRPIEVRAVAYPTVGTPRMLEPLLLNVRKTELSLELTRYVSPSGDDQYGDGTEAFPFKTMRRAALYMQHRSGTGSVDHGTIYLMAGDHEFGGEAKGGDPVTRHAFLTIRPAPGLTREQVRITAGGRLDCSRVRVRDLTIDSTRLSATRGTNAVLWLDNCSLVGKGKTDDVTFASRTQWTGGIFVTDCQVRDVLSGLSGATLVRNVSVTNTLSDALSNCLMIVNCRVDQIDKEQSKEHPDVLQWYIRSPLDNVIVYGLTATNARAQGIFVSGEAPVTNVAFVNVLIEMDSDTYFSQWHCSAVHLLFWNTSMVNRPLAFRHDNIAHLSVRDSVFYELRGIDLHRFPNVVVENNHFIQGEAIGEGSTMGDPLWRDAANDDYAPARGSPLLDRGRRPLVPVDARGQVRRTPASLGALQPGEAALN